MSTVLEAKEITAGYGGPPAIRDISIHVDAGEIVALLGPNGAGKTTTLLSLVGELPLGREPVWALSARVARSSSHCRHGTTFASAAPPATRSSSCSLNFKPG